MTATVWSHMEVGPHRGTRGGKGPRARLYNTLQQIVVDECKRQDRRFRWIRFADASKQQVEALFSWRESLDSWHLWDFDQEAFEVIQAADNAYQQRLASVETAGVVLPQGVQSQDRAAASGAAEAASSAADWLRPPTPPSASSWLQDSRCGNAAGEQQGTVATKIEVPIPTKVEVSIASKTRTDCCYPCGTSGTQC